MRRGFPIVLLGFSACAQKSPPAATAPPSTVLYHTGGLVDRSVMAVVEDGSRAPLVLSQPGVSTQFVAALPAHRALLAERAPDGSQARIVAVSVDGTSRQVWAELPAGAYHNVMRALPAGDGAVVALVAGGDEGPTDLYAIAAGAAPVLLARSSVLVAADARRVAFLAGGDLRSVALDGSAPLALGGGDGQDRVVQASGGRLLLTLHAAPQRDVRVVGLDGVITTIATSADETAFALGDRIVFSRDGAIVSTSLDGSDERVLARDATPAAMAPDGRVLFRTAQGALLISGEQSRVVDPAIGGALAVHTVTATTAIYTTDDAGASEVRTARLDGSAVARLYTLDLAPLTISTVTSDGRVVFTVPLVGDPDQAGGGLLYSARFDGSELVRIGTRIGALAPVDQDFEAITPAGRLVVEVEYHTGGIGSQLTVATPGALAARQISTAATAARYAGLVP